MEYNCYHKYNVVRQVMLNHGGLPALKDQGINDRHIFWNITAIVLCAIIKGGSGAWGGLGGWVGWGCNGDWGGRYDWDGWGQWGGRGYWGVRVGLDSCVGWGGLSGLGVWGSWGCSNSLHHGG